MAKGKSFNEIQMKKYKIDIKTNEVQRVQEDNLEGK